MEFKYIIPFAQSKTIERWRRRATELHPSIGICSPSRQRILFGGFFIEIEKGKPSERVGRKATEPTLRRLGGGRSAGLP